MRASPSRQPPINTHPRPRPRPRPSTCSLTHTHSSFPPPCASPFPSSRTPAANRLLGPSHRAEPVHAHVELGRRGAVLPRLPSHRVAHRVRQAGHPRRAQPVHYGRHDILRIALCVFVVLRQKQRRRLLPHALPLLGDGRRGARLPRPPALPPRIRARQVR